MPVNYSEGEIRHVQNGIARNIRIDGRSRTDTRAVSIERGVVKTAYGSSHVILGGDHGSSTEVVVAVYGQVVPSENGRYWFHVDPAPLTASDSSPIDGYERTKETFASSLETQLSQVYGADRPVNKGVHPDATVIYVDNEFPEESRLSVNSTASPNKTESAWEIQPMEHLPSLPRDWPAGSKTAIDRETLRVGEGLSWCLRIEVLIVGSSGGNIMLTATSAINAALRDAKLPQVELGVEGSAEVKLLADRSVPIQHTNALPLASLIICIKHFFILDPSAAEEQLPCSKAFVVAVDTDGALEAFFSCATAQTSLPIPATDMLCMLSEAPILLKPIHAQFETAFAEAKS